MNKLTQGEGQKSHIQILHQNIQTLAPPWLSVDPLQHGRHLARLDALQHLNDRVQVRLLGRFGPGVDGHLETSAQGALGVAAPEQLSHLAVDGARVGLADFRKGRVQRRHVKVDRRVFGESVNVDGAPGVAERCLRVLLDDGHVVDFWLVGWLVDDGGVRVPRSGN